MALPVWTADTDHFTVDDNKWHTADGWHRDKDDVGSDGARRKRMRTPRKPTKSQLKHEDEVAMDIIRWFVSH